MAKEPMTAAELKRLYELKWQERSYAEDGFLEDDHRLHRARLGELKRAMRTAMDNIGVPGPDYPAAVAYAYDVLDAALNHATPPGEREAAS